MAKKKTILDLYEMKERGEQAVWMVLYDSIFDDFLADLRQTYYICTPYYITNSAQIASILSKCCLSSLNIFFTETHATFLLLPGS